MTSTKKLMDLTERRVMVTGASGHLGVEICDTIAEAGGNLVVLDQDPVELEALKTQLQSRWGIEVDTISCDLESEPSRVQMINKILSDTKPLHGLINNAAFVGSTNLKGWNEQFHDQSSETWRRAFEVNLTSIFHLVKDLSLKMKTTQNASVVNIASIYASLGPDWSLYEGTEMGNPAAYGCSKAGVLQLTRWLATTLSPEIRVNAISPGGILRNQPSSFIRKYEKKTPLNRMAVEADFRGIVLFLISDASAYVTGQNITVDGGIGIS